MDALRRRYERMAWSVREACWPRRCAGCGVRGTWACDDCVRRAPQWKSPWCPRCGVPDGLGCLCHDVPSSVSIARSGGGYHDWLETAIHRLKYGGEFARAAHLGAFMADAASDMPEPDLVIPVPLHPARMRQRGYNQSMLLAEAAGRWSGWTIDETVARRIVDTSPQARLSGAARQANVRSAFEIDPLRMPQGAHVLIVDDVMTTGATTGELARVLLQAGAARIDVVTVARAIPRRATVI